MKDEQLVQKLKFDIIHTTISPCDNERRIFNEASTASEDGFFVKIIALKIPEVPRISYITNGIIKRLSIKNWRNGLFKFLSFNLKLLLHLLKEKFQLIHVHDLWVLPASSIAKFLKRKPLIYDVHEYARGLEIFREKKRSGFVWGIAEKLFIRFVDSIICINQFHANLLKETYPQIPHPSILMNFPSIKMENSEAALSDFKSRENMVIFQGILKQGRNLHRIIESMQFVESGCLKILGHGELEMELRNVVDALGLDKKIQFIGKYSWDKIHQQSSKARAALVLFDSDSLNYRYAAPNKFFEAVFAGTPVIASRIPSFEYYLSKFEVGLLIDASSPSNIADAIEKLLTDENSWDRFHSNCLKARVEWNWEKQEDQLVKIYREFI